ncbi:DNA-3-methyladenine glycosylase 2 family protein [Cohnella endophytica]|uniref:DNA-3-methyladenine glycosylase II n=2 Tax=Cohnella endophytica TaxID=2419778 RepID=A0A494YCK0_9BACL|nr:DNA-3-methyladenine glycosylase [Cohnella endophytica]RKP58011.1 DNA-3-methyladenine glycosylase 2 family protein [Cohnella endophytica]
MNQTITIPVPKEFHFGVNLDYLARSPDECLYLIRDDKLYKAIPVAEQPRLFEVSGDESGNLLIRSLDEEEWSANVVQEIVSYVREWFDLDNDLTQFYAMAKNDPILSGVTSRLFGLRTMGIPDLFEALCWGIIGQQINLAFAYTLKRRFVETFGRKVRRGEIEVWLFPTPQNIAELEVERIAELKMTTKKSEYLIGVAKLLLDGNLSKERLLEAESFKAAEKQLVSIRGIGPWTANYVLMRCLRYPASFPIDDVGLHNAIKSVLNLQQKPTVARIKELAVGWENWEAYATFYLWRVLY